MGHKSVRVEEVGLEVVWFGVGDVEGEQWGTRLERGGRSNCFQGRTQENCPNPCTQRCAAPFLAFHQ